MMKNVKKGTTRLIDVSIKHVDSVLYGGLPVGKGVEQGKGRYRT